MTGGDTAETEPSLGAAEVVVARRLLLDGRVQGVWFRESCRSQATQLGVTGWVRNVHDGRVEVWIEGDAHGVEALTDWCRIGPSLALVTEIACEERAPSGFQAFEVRA